MIIKYGVMLMKGDKAWGVVYEDGHSTSYGWIIPEFAPIHDPEFCKRPEDVTYPGDRNLKEIKTGKLVHVKRTTTIQLTIMP